MEFDVAIVGFGPVGALFANLLGVRGVRTVVIEREREVYRLPRAVHFDDEVMRMLQSVGLAEESMTATAPIRGYEFLNAEKEMLFYFDMMKGTTSQGWQRDYMFHQPSLEACIRDAASKRDSVEVLLDHELAAFSEEEAHVDLVIRDRIADEEHALRARYLVGCDGANSFVRKQAGLALEDLGFDEPWLVVDAKIDAAPAERGLPTACTQLCDPARPVTFIPVSGPYIRWEFMLRPEEEKQAMLDPARVDALISEWIDPGQIEVIRSAVYDFHALVAERWNTRRVFLAGDSAHQMPPFLGQGMCSGMRDAANLAWKLEMVTSGTASPDILESYQVEREPHVRHIIQTAIDMGRIICTLDPQAAQQRDRHWLSRPDRRLEVAELPGLTEGLILTETPLAGAPGLQARVRSETGEIGLLDDAVGPGFALLARGRSASALDEAARERLDRMAVHHVRLDENADVDGAYARWFDQHGCDAVLVRPDHRVFGSARGEAAAGQLIAALSRQLESP
jgi:3-(3-hydroxy-phenyl)propionate hydroxylase